MALPGARIVLAGCLSLMLGCGSDNADPDPGFVNGYGQTLPPKAVRARATRIGGALFLQIVATADPLPKLADDEFYERLDVALNGVQAGIRYDLEGTFRASPPEDSVLLSDPELPVPCERIGSAAPGTLPHVGWACLSEFSHALTRGHGLTRGEPIVMQISGELEIERLTEATVEGNLELAVQRQAPDAEGEAGPFSGASSGLSIRFEAEIAPP
jgi:hypothetical protein